GAPALEVVLRKQLLDLAGVIGRRLARDLDGVVAEAREPRQRRLDRFRPHPVVHRQFQCHLTLHSNVQFLHGQSPSFPGFNKPLGSRASLIRRSTSRPAPCCAGMNGASFSPTPWWSLITAPAPRAAVTPSFQMRSCRVTASGPPSGRTNRA